MTGRLFQDVIRDMEARHPALSRGDYQQLSDDELILWGVIDLRRAIADQSEKQFHLAPEIYRFRCKIADAGGIDL